jgi:DNA-binding NarL/FixJ family response regulator
MTVRLVLVEDHPIVADGLRAAFRGRAGMEVVGQAATLQEGRDLLVNTPCNVVLLDLRLPDGSGIELLREALDLENPPAFLVLSSFLTPSYVSATIALGASGFLLKTSPVEDILAAVDQIAEGGLAFSPEQLRASRGAAWAPLTRREHAILDAIIRGRSNDEIAMDLGIAKKTVEGYISRMLARYGLMTRTELAVHAERGQLLDLPVRDSARGGQ